MNSILVETWEGFKLSSTIITQNAFNKTHLVPISPTDIDTNHQDFLSGTKQQNRQKADEIGRTEKAIIAPKDM